MGINKTISFINCSNRPTMKLYRYFSNIEYAIEEIESGEIYCPMSDSFNDVFDSKFINNGVILDANVNGKLSVIIDIVNKILLNCKEFMMLFPENINFNTMEALFRIKMSKQTEISPKEYLSFVHKYAEISDSYDSFYESIKKSYIEKQPVLSFSKRIACFSEVNDSLLMWSYYADKHQGICLEYDPVILNDGKSEDLQLFNSLQKVHYSEKQYNDSQYIHSTNDLNNVFFTKALCWAHEQEWRLVLMENIERIKFPCLSGIYLGVKFREKYLADDTFLRIIKRASSKKTPIGLYEAHQDNKEYKINFSTLIPVNKKW